MSKILARMSTAVAAVLLMTAGPSVYALDVNVDYDLSSSTLHKNYDHVNGLDWYTSLPLDLGGVTVTEGDIALNTVKVRFRSATNMTQILTVDQIGQSGLENAPSTFGSPSFIGSGVHGDHGFGPSITLVGDKQLKGGFAVVWPTVFDGRLSWTYTGGTPAACTGGTCDFGVILHDLIDGDASMGLTGFWVTFFLDIAGKQTALDALTFNVIAPEISVTQIPEPATVVLMLAGLAALGVAKVRGRTNRRTEYAASA